MAKETKSFLSLLFWKSFAFDLKEKKRTPLQQKTAGTVFCF